MSRSISLAAFLCAAFCPSLAPAQLLAAAPPAFTASAVAQNPPPSAAPPAIVARPAVPNRLNEVLPTWLRVRGEFRERVEGFDSAGFTPDRDDAYSLSRLRLNATVTPSPYVSFMAQVQDARVADKQVGPTTAPFRGPFDLRLASADLGSARSPVAARVGRQELAFGEQRLLGHLAWTNTARSWDAGRLILRSTSFSVDVFAASLVRSLPDGFDKSGNGNRLYGAYGSAPTLVPMSVVEPFVFFRQEQNLRSELGQAGSLQQATMGVRLAGKLPARLDYNTDMAWQRGSLASDAIAAWAGHWMLRRSWPGKTAVKLISEYNYATGDSGADGVRHTFDQLYPTGHDKLGLADQVGWRNVRHIREGFELSPFRATPVSVNYHSWWLANTADALYAAGGAAIARVAGGAADSHVGQELDVQITRSITPQLQFAAGYAHMFTGAFLKQATPGASYSQPYVMATYVFLADK